MNTTGFSRSMLNALVEAQDWTKQKKGDFVETEDLFAGILSEGAKTKLWSILVRLGLEPNNVEQNLKRGWIKKLAKKVPGKNKDFSTELFDIIAIARDIASKKEKPHTDCLGVSEFFLACVQHVNNKPMGALMESGFNLLAIAQKAAK